MTRNHECPLVVDRLPNLLENDVPASELLLLRAHLEDCESCARALEGLRGITSAIVSDRAEDAWIEESLRRVPTMLALEPSKPVAAPRRKIAVSVAALLCLAATLRLTAPDGFTTATLGSLSRVVLHQFEPLADHFRGLRFLSPGQGEER